MAANDMHRKTRSDAKLKKLDEELQARLYETCETSSLDEALEWLRDEMKITVARSTLGAWAADRRRRLWIEECESEAAELEELLSNPKLKLRPEQIGVIGNAVFLNRASKEGDTKAFVAVASTIQRSQELEAQQAAHKDKMAVQHKKLELQQANLQRQLKELEMKVAQYEKEKAAAAKALNAAEKKGASPTLIEGVRKAMNFRPPAGEGAAPAVTPKAEQS